MTDTQGPSEIWHDIARRAVARDTLLQLAAAAEAVLDVEPNESGRRYQLAQGGNIFQTALDIHLGAAMKAATDDMRAKYLGYAADLLEYSAVVKQPLRCSWSVLELRIESHDLLSRLATRFGVATDLTAEVVARMSLGRTYRCAGQHQDCESLLNQSETYFYRTGVEHLHWEFDAQRLANLIDSSQGGQAAGLDGESGVWDSQPMAADWRTEHRFDFMRGLADLADGKPRDAWRRLDAARSTLMAVSPSEGEVDGKRRYATDRQATERHAGRADIQRISVLLGHADAAAAAARTHADPGAGAVVVDDLSEALAILARLRVRWRVVARSRSPLARAFHRIYGEIALVAASLGTSESAGIGLHVALAVKQTGFAQLLRTERSTLDAQIRKIMSRIVTIEDDLARSGGDDLDNDRQRLSLDKSSRHIENIVSPLLAQMTMPSAPDLDELAAILGDRDALDLVTVEDIYGARLWFRAWVRRGRAHSFERFDLGETTGRYLYGGSGSNPEPPRREVLAGTSSRDVMWRVWPSS